MISTRHHTGILYLFCAAALLLHAMIFGGIFDKELGTDSYLYLYFLQAAQQSINLVDLISRTRFDVGYVATAYALTTAFGPEGAFFAFRILILIGILTSVIVLARTIRLPVSTTLWMLALYCCYFVAIDLVVNLQRSGAAAPALICAAAFFLRDQFKRTAGAWALSILFHWSIALTLPAFVISRFKKVNLNVLSLVFFALFATSLTGLTEAAIRSLLPDFVLYEHHLRIISQDSAENTGLALFVLTPVLLRMLAASVLLRCAQTERLDRLLTLYIFVAIPYFFISFLPFSNRFAYLSLIFWPFFLSYLAYLTVSNTVRKIAVGASYASVAIFSIFYFSYVLQFFAPWFN